MRCGEWVRGREGRLTRATACRVLLIDCSAEMRLGLIEEQTGRPAQSLNVAEQVLDGIVKPLNDAVLDSHFTSFLHRQSQH